MGQPHVRPVKWNVRNCGCSNFFCGCPIKDETLYGWMCSVAGKRIEDFSGGIDQTLENVDCQKSNTAHQFRTHFHHY
ncbi:hypothetical protein CEXT_313941 [Caerostris extrusa]|uniref:Uncharacterized protein n=1 Tax=Caerostris extrusa TaxID=172846 RepID=A0AAV4PE43_CAEEX|nr:hypothetical protein CEXT_313941 [Caerostris extrusa]